MLKASFKPFVSTDDNEKRTEHKNINKKVRKIWINLNYLAVLFPTGDSKLNDWKITRIIHGENESLLTYSCLINRCRLFASHQFPFHSRLQLWRSEKKTRQIGFVRTITNWIKKAMSADSTQYKVIARSCHLQVCNFQRSSIDHKAISLHQISISIYLRDNLQLILLIIIQVNEWSLLCSVVIIMDVHIAITR